MARTVDKSKVKLHNQPRIREFVAFLWGSGVGLMLDLMSFQGLVWLGVDPWLANASSSTASITAVYFLVTRYSFDARAGWRTFTLFVAWYGSSIIVFSSLIQFMTTEGGWFPLGWKLASVPVSFGLNYLFSRYLFRRPDRGMSPQIVDA